MLQKSDVTGTLRWKTSPKPALRQREREKKKKTCVILSRTSFLPGFLTFRRLRDSPEEDVEAEHGEHDGEVAQDSHGVAQLVDEQEPLVDHPAGQTREDG